MENNKSVVMKILKACYMVLSDKKAEDIKILKVAGKSSITDYFIIASGNSEPHLRALRSVISRTLHELKCNNIRIDYKPDSGWVVVDGFDFMVHILSPGMRSSYNLDQLWQDAEGIDFSK